MFAIDARGREMGVCGKEDGESKLRVTINIGKSLEPGCCTGDDLTPDLSPVKATCRSAVIILLFHPMAFDLATCTNDESFCCLLHDE